MSIQSMVDDPMWFYERIKTDKERRNNELTEEFVTGYCQAVYQIRLKLSSLDQEPEGIRLYTEFMIEELNKLNAKVKQAKLLTEIMEADERDGLYNEVKIHQTNKKQLNMRNHFNYWYKRFIKDGLKAIKLVIGLGLAAAIAFKINLPIGIMFFGWVLVEALIDRN